jgi:AmmeMemoRadiSam system protein A
MRSLDSRERQLLLDVARHAVMSAVTNIEVPRNVSDDANSAELTGAFVTLRRCGLLRGCIGEINSRESLVNLVSRCARAAAVEDPRFGPVRPDEMAEIKIEISILSPPRECKAREIEPGKHGLIVSCGYRRGVLLPQVATERGWKTEHFLEEACFKAGLEGDAWKDRGTRIEIFTAEVFGEASSQIDEKRNSPDRAKPGYSIST